MSDREELLFIGGLVDGTRMTVPVNAQTYVFPFSPEPLMLYNFTEKGLAKGVRSGQTPYIYYKATFYAGNGTKIKFMVHTSVKVEEAMQLLLKNYNPSSE